MRLRSGSHPFWFRPVIPVAPPPASFACVPQVRVASAPCRLLRVPRPHRPQLAPGFLCCENPTSMKLTINGEDRAFAPAESLAALIDQLGIKSDRVAIELNRE